MPVPAKFPPPLVGIRVVRIVMVGDIHLVDLLVLLARYRIVTIGIEGLERYGDCRARGADQEGQRKEEEDEGRHGGGRTQIKRGGP